MRTRDGFEVKEGCVYYSVFDAVDTFSVTKIRCRSFARLRGIMGMTNRFYKKRTNLMMANDSQEFTAPETRRFLFKSAEVAKWFAINMCQKRLKHLNEKMKGLTKTDPRRMKVKV